MLNASETDSGCTPRPRKVRKSATSRVFAYFVWFAVFASASETNPQRE